MKERGILFRPEMMVALLAGKKTQTRRIIKPQPQIVENPVFVENDYGLPVWEWKKSCEMNHYALIHYCPYGQKGDVLWTRETIGFPKDGGEVIYRADGGFAELPDFAKAVLKKGKWTPAIHQKRIHSRAILLIKNIRVERLQDITEADALAEGFVSTAIEDQDGKDYCGSYARENFQSYIDQINGEGTWKANPWFWVIDFELMKGNQS